jgi:hypothetical protein
LRSSGASPTTGERSGVKLSGPQKNFFTPASSEIGTRAIAFSTYGAMRSQSGGSSPNEKSSGMPPTFHGAQIGSNMPIIKPPTSSRKYPYDPGSSSTGNEALIDGIFSVIR